MRRIGMTARRRLRFIAALSLLGLVAVIATGGSASGAVTLHGFRQINLVSDIPGRAQLTDSHLVNPWGIAAGPTTPLWVADNGTGVATLYAGSVQGSPVMQVPLIVSVMGLPAQPATRTATLRMAASVRTFFSFISGAYRSARRA